eukprot:CAMPEP_0179218940 /NCGR_PEP_ID=MMETSP0797-20121207/4748_1 /TAXON_ID=47934 /ORGANISM="Dinophysis acuminata, Strain DAEP01" /LENGTH=180 /DNA_ID=CAMNT_0020925335 /DNA_START=361 /DNA_END=898 /DNA_ORIENTATION=-
MMMATNVQSYAGGLRRWGAVRPHRAIAVLSVILSAAMCDEHQDGEHTQQGSDGHIDDLPEPVIGQNQERHGSDIEVEDGAPGLRRQGIRIAEELHLDVAALLHPGLLAVAYADDHAEHHVVHVAEVMLRLEGRTEEVEHPEYAEGYEHQADAEARDLEAARVLLDVRLDLGHRVPGAGPG